MNRSDTPGWLYVVMCVETRRLKLGWCRDGVEKRLSSLQTGSPTELQPLIECRGTQLDERDIERGISEFRIARPPTGGRPSGEWYVPEAFPHLYRSLLLMADVRRFGPQRSRFRIPVVAA